MHRSTGSGVTLGRGREGCRRVPTRRPIERAGVELAQAQALLAPIDLSEIAKPLAAVVEAVAREIDGKRTGALATEFDDAHGGAKAGPQLRVLDLAVQAAALAS